MNNTKSEAIEFVKENDVKFIRLAFCDPFGVQKNLSVMPAQIERAFEKGIPFRSEGLAGMEGAGELFLIPEAQTITLLPWRPSHGRVVRFCCRMVYPDGRPYEADCRELLKTAVETAKKAGAEPVFATECEFTLFHADDEGRSTGAPLDHGGYLDMNPLDLGENVRREICLTLEQMNLCPESSRHERLPGQNAVVLGEMDALSCADAISTFQIAARAVAAKNGLVAELGGERFGGICKNATDLKMSADETFLKRAASRLPETTLLGNWQGALFEGKLSVRMGESNPYLALALLLFAGLESERKDAPGFPPTREASLALAMKSEMISKYLPAALLKAYSTR